MHIISPFTIFSVLEVTFAYAVGSHASAGIFSSIAECVGDHAGARPAHRRHPGDGDEQAVRQRQARHWGNNRLELTLRTHLQPPIRWIRELWRCSPQPRPVRRRSLACSGMRRYARQPSPSHPLGLTSGFGSTSSNGYNWVDYLTLMYNKDVVLTYDFAYEGATIDEDL